jgi:D-sedoheptulose 7-phosphate isomerase
MNKLIKKHILEHKAALDTIPNIDKTIQVVGNLLSNCLENGRTIFWCGNGGSASDSQHLAGELVGRFVGNRKPLKSIALTADSSVITCIVNDYGYESIFSRQVEALGSVGDVLVGISTSGNSKNILNALNVANNKGMHTVGLLGKGGGKAASLSQHSMTIESDITARVQEMHIFIGHILCDLIEENLNLKK